MSEKLTPFKRYEAYTKKLLENKQPLPVNQYGFQQE